MRENSRVPAGSDSKALENKDMKKKWKISCKERKTNTESGVEVYRRVTGVVCRVVCVSGEVCRVVCVLGVVCRVVCVLGEIGRASCRGRVEISVVDVSL